VSGSGAFIRRSVTGEGSLPHPEQIAVRYISAKNAGANAAPTECGRSAEAFDRYETT
jgi:hypothetical protein